MAKNDFFQNRPYFLGIFFSSSIFFFLCTNLKISLCYCAEHIISFKIRYYTPGYVMQSRSSIQTRFRYFPLFWRPFCFSKWPPWPDKKILMFFNSVFYYLYYGTKLVWLSPFFKKKKSLLIP